MCHHLHQLILCARPASAAVATPGQPLAPSKVRSSQRARCCCVSCPRCAQPRPQMQSALQLARRPARQYPSRRQGAAAATPCAEMPFDCHPPHYRSVHPPEKAATHPWLSTGSVAQLMRRPRALAAMTGQQPWPWKGWRAVPRPLAWAATTGPPHEPWRGWRAWAWQPRTAAMPVAMICCQIGDEGSPTCVQRAHLQPS